ncbi:ribonuclease H-like domain-containing protein [Schizophyllum fasciatum]
MASLKRETMLTFQINGWEDRLRRSLYGSVAARMGEPSSVLRLGDLTGIRATAQNIFQEMMNALNGMELSDGLNFVALVTDNPNTMKAFRRLATSSQNFPWMLSLFCFLHTSNRLIGDISSYPTAKATIKKTTTILQKAADVSETKVHSLKQNCESRWYAMTLQSISVRALRLPLQTTCLRSDAQQATDGLSPVKANVIQTVLFDQNYWNELDQLIRLTKPMVDMIGNLESLDATLVDCVLELLRCARMLSAMSPQPSDDPEFLQHAKDVFNRRFIAMVTPIHALALFLHPLCRTLALSAAETLKFTLQTMQITALEIAAKWRWSRDEVTARQLARDLELYNTGKGVWSGGKADALDWWRNLPITAVEHPIKTLAILLFSVVPHSAEVERLFSSLGGVQSPKRCNLSVEKFEALGKCRAHYSRQVWENECKSGKSAHRKHGHMHTRVDPGADKDLIEALDANWSYNGVFDGDSADEPETEGFAMDELEAEFAKLQLRSEEELEDVSAAGREVLRGKMFNLRLLDAVDKGVVINPYDEEVEIVPRQEGEQRTWTPTSILSSLK